MNTVKASKNDIGLLAEMNKQLIDDQGHRNPMSLGDLEKRMISFFETGYRAELFEEDGEIQGYCLWRFEENFVYIRQFFINRDSRRRGKGQNYFKALKNQFWLDKQLKLEVLIDNEAALKFWRSLGFTDYAITLESE